MAEGAQPTAKKPRIVGRYALFGEIAAGGMATVHFGRLVGPVGFSRTVAIKRLHPQFAKDPEFVSMFLDEARLASRIQHPNVVTTLDIVALDSEIFLVMEYVQGESLSKLVKSARRLEAPIPHGVAVSVLSGMLHGLHAAHEAKSERREPLNIVHRDVSPQNVLVGTDGVARVLDFGVAKAAMRTQSTRDGQMKGKLSYMSPEQLSGKEVDRRTDIFAAGVVAWEALAARRLFEGADAGEILAKVLTTTIPTPRSLVPDIPEKLSDAVMKSLERDPAKRFQTAREFAIALETTAPTSPAREVGEWVEKFGGGELQRRAQMVADIETVPVEVMDRMSGVPMQTSSEPRSEVSSKQQRPSGVTPGRQERPSSTKEPSTGGSLASASTSQVASLVSDSSPVADAFGKPRRGRVVAGAVAVVLGAIALFVIYDRLQPAPAVEPVRPASSGAGVTAEPPALPSAAKIAGQPADAGAAAATPSAREPTHAVAPKEKRAPVGRSHVRAPAPPPKAPPPVAPAPSKTKASNPACNPPWTIDSSGIRRLKPQCL